MCLRYQRSDFRLFKQLLTNASTHRSFLPPLSLLLLHKHRCRLRHRRRVQLTHRCASIASNQTILRRRRGRGGEGGGGREESNIIIRRSRVFMTAECDFFFFILPFFCHVLVSFVRLWRMSEWVSKRARQWKTVGLVWSGCRGWWQAERKRSLPDNILKLTRQPPSLPSLSPFLPYKL